MNLVSAGRAWRLGILLTGLLASSLARADVLSAVQSLREAGCGGALPVAAPLHHSELLDRAAAQWALSHSFAAALERSGFHGSSASGLYLSGSDAAVLELLRNSYCNTVAKQTLHEVGLYRRGSDTWVVLATGAGTDAAPAVAGSWRPDPSGASLAPAAGEQRASRLSPQAPFLASRALELVNEVRARGARCGAHAFAPAPPVTLSGTLGSVALGHAADMAEHNYFEHEDLAGQSPADRVRAVGYKEKLVGENIAYGPQTVEEVVRGWLDSPGHCENIMDPRFAEMGLGYATGHGASRHGLYWVQVLAAPRI